MIVADGVPVASTELDSGEAVGNPKAIAVGISSVWATGSLLDDSVEL